MYICEYVACKEQGIHQYPIKLYDAIMILCDKHHEEVDDTERSYCEEDFERYLDAVFG